MKRKSTHQREETISTFDKLLEKRYGKIGSKKRTEFELKAKVFATREIIIEQSQFDKHF